MLRALPDVWNRKVARLPDHGVLLVCTDLHGNVPDYERMLELYVEEEERGNMPILAFCGDLVHGPPDDMLERWPSYLGTPYRDESAALIRAFEVLTRSHRAFSLMGNHEHSHIGGPVVPKFHPDEARVLDASLGREAARIHAFFESFPLVAVAPCGLVLTHAAPAATLPDAASFEQLDYAGYDELPFHAMVEHDALSALLWARSCRDSDAVALLEALTGRPEGVVAFGHDIVRDGHAVEGPHHICVSTSFGLEDASKQFLRIELSQQYGCTGDVQLGREILPLYH